MDFQWEVAKDQYGSDHFPIFIKVLGPQIDEKVPKWKFRQADWRKYSELCAQSINRDVFQDKDDLVPSLTASIIEAANEAIPKSSTKSRHVNKPWFTDDCKRAVRQRKKALDKFTHQPTHANLVDYRAARAKARRVVKESKRSSWKQYVSKLNCHSSVKKVWEMVRKISGKQSVCASTHLTKGDGTKAVERKDIANTLAENFERNSSSQHYTEKFQRFKAIKERQAHVFRSDNSESYNGMFSLKELKTALGKAHDTAVGPDDVHYQLLKHLPEESLLVLLNVFNDIWISGVFPDSWHQATVIPIPKPGKDATKATNYRPIALTSCICKTMERMINTRLVWYLESNNLITKFQSGFRKNRSTTDQLVRFETVIRDAFVRGEHVVSVFFDLEKAYDTTWKYGIMDDLFNMGLRGRMPIFIKQFLSDRSFNVRLGSVLSDVHSQEMGVPQGSILSPTLFSVKMNSIVKVLNPGVDCSLYVDDFLICYSSKNMQTIERQLQLCLNKIQKWADENGFRFSKSKTVCMHFCNKRKLHPDPTLLLDGTAIPLVTETKFLGLMFDSKLNFKPHIDYLRGKCFKALNLLKVVGSLDWGADRQVCLRLYRSLVRSKLDYGSIVYGSARPSYLKRLETVQNQALRICLGAYRTSPIPSLHVEANEPPMHLRREKLALQYALKLKANPTNPAHDVIFFPKYEEFYTSKPNAIRSFGLRIRPVLNDVLPDLSQVSECSFSVDPPWEFVYPEVNLSLTRDKKNYTDDHLFRVKFEELRNQYVDYAPIYTDGSKEGHKVGAAAICSWDKAQVRLPDDASIFTAELQAILMALGFITQSPLVFFIIFSDSLSSLLALMGDRCGHPYVLQILEKCSDLAFEGKRIVFAWIPSHVGISGNEKADKAAKEALGLPIADLKIPYTDFKQCIHKHLKVTWQVEWNRAVLNKLFCIKPHLGLWPFSSRKSRREEVVLARLRIGHSYLTHSFLLKDEPLPECIPCDCPLTVKHILIDCIDFALVRQKYFHVNSMKELFEEVDPSNILNFIKEIGLLYKI